MFKPSQLTKSSFFFLTPIVFAMLCLQACGGGSGGSGTANTPNANNGASPGTTVEGPQNPAQAEVVPAARVATSTETLKGMAPPTVNLAGVRKKKEIHLNPNVLVSLGPSGADAALQPPPAQSQPAGSSSGKNIAGMGSKFKGPQGDFQMESAPPDTTGAVGDTQFVQWVNDSLSVFNKNTGAVEVGPILGLIDRVRLYR